MLIYAFVFIMALTLSGDTQTTKSPYPMSWDFKDITTRNQSYWYTTTLPRYTNNGLKPIPFPSTNASANYQSQTWMDPCYDRYYATTDPGVIVYWLVNGEMFCEVLVLGPASMKETPTYSAQYLMRIEQAGTRCQKV